MIERYFDAICRLVIDEFNFLTSGLSKGAKEEFAEDRVNEADVVVRLGRPFGPFARYMKQRPETDIIIDHKDFLIEVKYWRPKFGGTGNQKKSFEDTFQDDFDWLCGEIASGKKHHRAFIAAWSPVFEWSDMLRLGTTTGSNPPVAPEKLMMLPFLKTTDGRFSSMYTDYATPEGNFRVSVGERPVELNWRLFGTGSDFLNLAMFW